MADTEASDINTPNKRKHGDVSMASPGSETSSPEPKRPNADLEELDIDNMPSGDASAAEWGKYMVDQLMIMNRNMQKIAHSSSFASDQAADALKEIGSVSTSVGKITMKMMSVKNENASLKQQNIDLNEKILSLECYQRRNNLRFDGIREERYESDYDCYWKEQPLILFRISFPPRTGILQCRFTNPVLRMIVTSTRGHFPKTDLTSLPS